MLRNKISQSLKDSLKSKDQIATSTLRLIIAALKDRDISSRSEGNQEGVSDSEILKMLQSMIKQRKESYSLYEQAGRLDLAQREEQEIDVIKNFLPKQIDSNELEEVIKKSIEEVDADSLKDMGKVMSFLREKYVGQIDFSQASEIVKKQLSA